MALPRLLPGRQTALTMLVLLLCCLMLLESASAYCTQGSEWIEYNGSCYHWSRSEVNWFSAELTCKKFGGHLVSIGSVSENNFLLRLTQCSAYYWIGMVNTVHALKHQVKGYEWWDGSRHNFTALNPKPINYYDCVYSDMYGNWTNLQCQSSFSYVCMAPAGGQQYDTDQQSQGADDGPKFGWWTYTDYTDSAATSVDPTFRWTPDDVVKTGTPDRTTWELETSVPYRTTEDSSTWDTARTTLETDNTTPRALETDNTTPRALETDSTAEEPRTSGSDGTTQDPRTWGPDVTTWRPDEEKTTNMPDVSTRIWPTTTPPSSTQSPTECPPGWQLMDSSCYFVSEGRTNYFNAQMSCQAMGATVSSILTPREHTLLTVALGCHSPTWIGLEKTRPCVTRPSPHGLDYCWVWMDRSPFIYQGWVQGGGNLNERNAECAIIDGGWKVMYCHAEYRYICKKSAY